MSGAALAAALTPFATGLGLGLGLILAIGPQNAFVLRQGLRGEHVLMVALVCALSDAALIAAGVAGTGAVLAGWPGLTLILRWAGASFLLAYGVLRLRAALRGGAALQPASGPVPSRGRVLAACLALTWLNPHLYLDTVLLIGSVSTRWPGQRLPFALGAISASFLFFFALAYGARLLRPLFARPGAWRVLDLAIAVLMFTLALTLLLGG